MSEERFDPSENRSEGTNHQQPPSHEGSNQPINQYGYNPYQTQNPNNTGYGAAGQGEGRRDDYRWNFEDYEAAGRRPTPKRSNGLMVIGVLLSLVLVVGIVALSGYGIYSLMARPDAITSQSSLGGSENGAPTSASPSLAIKDHPAGTPESAVDGRLSTVDIAQKVKPSVVGITQYSSYSTYEPAGEGSGIIMSADGYILTNAHVVADAIGLSVELDNGESYSAQLIGRDTRTDLAVLKIDAQNLTAAEFGNSDELRVGETVVAIGNPGGTFLAGSVTQGIVSGVNRVLQDGAYNAKFIQVDAAINPGNSGGALVNQFGQVVGINSSKIASVEYEGIGFAIPINEAKPIVDDLMTNGYVKGRVKIGISGRDINEMTAQYNNVPTGFQILTIDPSSDLAGKNVARGDIITHVEGTRIESFDQLSTHLTGKAPGAMLKLTIYRRSNGQSFDVTVQLMEDVETRVALQY